MPSPCGAYSQCREVNGQAVCSCLHEYIGNPPNCHPECTTSSECPLNEACINSKCVDPCPGTCGINANCHVNNHSPICTCVNSYTGDPFHRCYPVARKEDDRYYSGIVNNHYLSIQPLAMSPLLQPNPSIPACRLLAVRILNVNHMGTFHHAHVCPTIMALRQTVAPNVLSTLIVPVTKLAYGIVALILVRAPAA